MPAALLLKAAPLGLCRAGTAGSQRWSMIQAGDVTQARDATQAGDAYRAAFGIILLLAFVPRLRDSVPEEARAKSAVGCALPGCDRGEEGRWLLKHGPTYSVGGGERSFGCASLPPLAPLPTCWPCRAPEMPSGSFPSVVHDFHAAAAAPAFTPVSEAPQPRLLQHLWLPGRLGGPETRVPTRGAASVRPVAAGQAGRSAPDSLSWELGH